MNTIINVLLWGHGLIFLFLGAPIFAQNNTVTATNDQTTNITSNTAQSPQINNNVPDGFQDILLGLNSADVIAVIRENPLFLYRAKEIPSISIYESRILTVKGVRFIDNAYFYFSKDGILTSFVLFFNTDFIDYASMYKTLEQKYGRPKISVNKALWTDGAISMLLETPLSIKYFQEDSLSEQAEPDPLLTEEEKNEFLKLF